MSRIVLLVLSVCLLFGDPVLAQGVSRKLSLRDGGAIVGLQVEGIDGEAGATEAAMTLQGTVGAGIRIFRLDPRRIEGGVLNGSADFEDVQLEVLAGAGIQSPGAGFTGHVELQMRGLFADLTRPLTREDPCAGLVGFGTQTDIRLTVGEVRPGLGARPIRGSLLSGVGEVGVICQHGETVNAITAFLLLPSSPLPAFEGGAGLRYRHVGGDGVSIEATSGVVVNHDALFDGRPTEVSFQNEIRGRIPLSRRAHLVVFGGLDIPLSHTERDSVTGDRVAVDEPPVAVRAGTQVVVGL